MRQRIVALAALGFLAVAGPALAGTSGHSSTSAGGTTTTGSSSSSTSISSSGSSVGVVQGNVSGGSSTSGSQGIGDGTDQSGAASSGDSSNGQVVGATDASALKDGLTSKLDLPAVGTAADAIPASHSQAGMALTWAVAAAVLIGLVVLYRRLPRPQAS